jgi:hypothetical protein
MMCKTHFVRDLAKLLLVMPLGLALWWLAMSPLWNAGELSCSRAMRRVDCTFTPVVGPAQTSPVERATLTETRNKGTTICLHAGALRNCAIPDRAEGDRRREELQRWIDSDAQGPFTMSFGVTPIGWMSLFGAMILTAMMVAALVLMIVGYAKKRRIQRRS